MSSTPPFGRTDTQPRPRRAYVDETERKTPGDTWYLMCAVTVNPDSATTRSTMQELDRIAHHQPTSGQLNRYAIHASQMWLTQVGQRELFEAETIIAADPSLHLDVAARRVTTHQAFEQARQICVAHLVTHMDADVQIVTFDTRDPIETKTRKPKPGVDVATHRQLVNHHDLATINRLKANGRVKANVDIVWANDLGNPHLWIPDVIAYACGQALASGNALRLARLASHLHITEAVTNPDGADHVPATGIADKLESLRRLALERRNQNSDRKMEPTEALHRGFDRPLA